MSDLEEYKPEDGYVSWGEDQESKDKAFAVFSESAESYRGVKSQASHRSYLDIETNQSVRPEFTSQDYYAFRPSEATPSRQKESIRMCMKAYQRVGIVRNVIDLMGDFGSQGITLTHPNPKIETFYRNWWIAVRGAERSERILNTLFRCGTVVIRRRESRVNAKVRNEMSSGKVVFDSPKVKMKMVPGKYDVLNPLIVDVDGTMLDLFEGKIKYKMLISQRMRQQISDAQPDFMSRFGGGTDNIPLSNDEIAVYHYKKDDWQTWGDPMIFPILDDIKMMEKMKLADMSALDGAISNIRLWRIGDFEHKILPTKSTINRLRNILASNMGGGTMDLVWGPELDFKESQTEVHKFLGKEKYEPVLSHIYAGLGIPPTLTGIAGQSGGFTNNYISLKTLIERLQYGRDILLDFWTKEFKRVQKAMGFRISAKIHFDEILIADEASQRTLLTQLADRNIISDKTLLERLGEDYALEQSRVRIEEKARKDEKLPNKTSPYHDPMFEQKEEIKNKFAQNKDMGRPKNVVETTKRKEKKVNPKTKPGRAMMHIWASEAYDRVADILIPGILDHFGKKNVRSLSNEQTRELEQIKCVVFHNLDPMCEVTNSTVQNILKSDVSLSPEVKTSVDEMIGEYSKEGDLPTTGKIRQMHIITYCDLN